MRTHNVSCRGWLWGLLLLSLVVLPMRSHAAVATMTPEELRTKLGSPDVVVVDVRLGKDWKASESKIPGAIRVETDAIEGLTTTYAKDKTLVFYCA